MLSTRTLASMIAAGILVAAQGAHAGLMVDDGSGGSIPDAQRINDVFGDSSGSASAGFGANLYYSGRTKVRFTYLGAEAGFENEFSVLGRTIFSNLGSDASSAGDFVEYSFSGSGALPFSFLSGGDRGTVANGSNRDDSVLGSAGGVNFFVATDTTEYGSGLFLGFDDTVDPADDDDHDDLAIRVEQIQVPAPATLALFGAGLLGLGGALRRLTST